MFRRCWVSKGTRLRCIVRMVEGDDEDGKKAWWKTVEEASREELLLLEDQHPNDYHHLKLQLKSFISNLVNSQQQNRLSLPPVSLPPSSLICHTHHSVPNSDPIYICTQASTTNNVSRKRARKNEAGEEKDRVGAKPCPRRTARVQKKKDTVEAAIDRARDCLLKIRTLKKQLLPQRS